MSDDEILSEYLSGRLRGRREDETARRLLADAGFARRLRLLMATRSAARRAAPGMPEDLRDAIRARARRRLDPNPWEDWRAALATALWPAYGLGASFAAAALLLAARQATVPPGTERARPAAQRSAPAAPPAPARAESR